jgi:hypothetical protein
MEPVSANRTCESEADPEVALAADMLRAAWERVPEAKRRAVADLLADIFVPVRAPKRGGPVLENVIELFKNERRPEWSAGDVVTALSDRGVSAEPKKVYSALTYLSGMKILRRIGYGRYIIEGGALLITNDR